MRRVTGIGGIFFRSRDPAATAAWYREHLGIPVGEQGYCDYPWRELDEPRRIGRTVWSVFPDDTGYFGDDPAAFMVNYRVADLDALLERLRDEGVTVAEEREEYEFGRFGWITDPDGRRVELWEPAGESPDGHTFLLREGSWRAEGHFTGGDGRRAPAPGRARGSVSVSHGTDGWRIGSLLEIRTEERAREIRAEYSVEPPAGEHGLMRWTSENPEVGTMRGTFSVVGDTIMCAGGTDDGSARLVESVLQLGSEAYTVRGALHREGRLASRWELRLVRGEPETS